LLSCTPTRAALSERASCGAAALGLSADTDDPAVTMFIGPSTTGQPLEVGVVTDDEGSVVIHAMRAVHSARAAHRSWSEIGGVARLGLGEVGQPGEWVQLGDTRHRRGSGTMP
jgi:hypothetical protein